MECPRCKQSDISVIDSRDADGDAIRRRRQCDQCRFRFTTYERIEPIKLMVRKRDGSTEIFQREKVLKGLKLAAEKRGIADSELEAVADRIETKIMMCVEDELSSKQIGDYVAWELQRLDLVAYLRFVSVYHGFESLEAFEQALAEIRNTSSAK